MNSSITYKICKDFCNNIGSTSLVINNHDYKIETVKNALDKMNTPKFKITNLTKNKVYAIKSPSQLTEEFKEVIKDDMSIIYKNNKELCQKRFDEICCYYQYNNYYLNYFINNGADCNSKSGNNFFNSILHDDLKYFNNEVLINDLLEIGFKPDYDKFIISLVNGVKISLVKNDYYLMNFDIILMVNNLLNNDQISLINNMINKNYYSYSNSYIYTSNLSYKQEFFKKYENNLLNYIQKTNFDIYTIDENKISKKFKKSIDFLSRKKLNDKLQKELNKPAVTIKRMKI